MVTQSLQRVQTTDQEKQFMQDNVAKALAPLQNGPLNGGVLLKAVKLVAGQDNLVPHTLSRQPSIAITGLPDSSSIIWSPSADNTNINLHCSTNCTVSVWVS